MAVADERLPSRLAQRESPEWTRELRVARNGAA
jgi:hypothetical protein